MALTAGVRVVTIIGIAVVAMAMAVTVLWAGAVVRKLQFWNTSQIFPELKYCTYVSPKVHSTSMLCWAWTANPQSGLPAHHLPTREEKGITELKKPDTHFLTYLFILLDLKYSHWRWTRRWIIINVFHFHLNFQWYWEWFSLLIPCNRIENIL